jgi:hypothetical protein
MGRGDHRRVAAHRRAPASPLTSFKPPPRPRKENPGPRGTPGRPARQPGHRHTPALNPRQKRPLACPRQPSNPVNDQGEDLAHFADPCESMKSIPSQSRTIPVMSGADNATSRIRSSRAPAVPLGRTTSVRVSPPSPGHPGEGGDTGPASRHAGRMREPAGQPGVDLVRHVHIRSLTRARRHHAACRTRRLEVTACPAAITVMTAGSGSPLEPVQRMTGLLAHHSRSRSAH